MTTLEQITINVEVFLKKAEEIVQTSNLTRSDANVCRVAAMLQAEMATAKQTMRDEAFFKAQQPKPPKVAPLTPHEDVY